MLSIDTNDDDLTLTMMMMMMMMVMSKPTLTEADAHVCSCVDSTVFGVDKKLAQFGQLVEYHYHHDQCI